MIAHLTRLLRGLSQVVAPRKRQSRSQNSAKPRAERLEERVALSVYLPGASTTPVGCCCPSCAGQGYALAGQDNGAAYTAPGYKWSQSTPGATVTITYSYSNLLNGGIGAGLSAATLKATIEEALRRWAAVAPLRFVEVADAGPMPSPDNYNGAGLPMIRFGHRPIDGAYNVLAYGYYPSDPSVGIAGDIQFDTGESWSINPSAGMDLLEVATHEIGHALGLGHEPMPASGGQQAIMNPYYSRRFQGLGTSYLLADDINGIRALYGTGTGAVVPLSSAPPAPPPPPAPTTPTFTVSGNRLTVQGTDGADTFRLTVTPTTFQITCNNSTYTANRSTITWVMFQGNGGQDTSILTGGASKETAYFVGAASALLGPGYEIYTRGSERNTIYATAGEVVDYKGTGGADQFWATTTYSRMSGAGYENTALGHSQIWATADASDTAVLHGTAGDDILSASFADTYISGANYLAVARGFGSVDTHAGSGYDRAYLYDTAGNDLFISTPSQSWIQGPGFRIATGFEWVFGVGSSGYDQAFHYDSAGDDTFVSTPTSTYLSTASSVALSTGFDTYTAVMSTGYDAAHVYDSASDDAYSASGTQAVYAGSGRVVAVNSADVVVAYGSSGRNRRSLGPSSFATVFQGAWF